MAVHDGKRGVHLAFLFDPEIPKDLLFSAHGAATGNVPPWRDGRLRVSRCSADEVFRNLDAVFDHQGTGPHYVCYAPHSFGENGVFRETDTQIRNDLPWRRIAALDLGRSKLSHEELSKREWLQRGVEDYRLALIHTSDCYQPGTAAHVGSRFSFLKLARPSIAALRQAFLAAESRVACAYVRDPDGGLSESSHFPDPLAETHPWLRGVCPPSSSFFRAPPDRETESVRIELNPGLSCVIGGRMSGKSTLLDGLRTTSGSPLPASPDQAKDVSARAALFAGGGDPAVDLAGKAVGGGAWAPQFFTQRELQLAVKDQEKIRSIVYAVSGGESEGLTARFIRLAEIDDDLAQRADRRAEIRADLVEARQKLAQAEAAAAALRRFEDVGAGRIELAQSRASIAAARRDAVSAAKAAVATAVDTGSATPLPAPPSGVEDLNSDLLDQVAQREEAFSMATITLRKALDDLVETWDSVTRGLESRVESLRKEVVAALIERGGSQDELAEFDQHRRNAAQLDPVRREVGRIDALGTEERTTFEKLVEERNELVDAQRQALERVSLYVSDQFNGAIRVVVEEEGDVGPLDGWIRGIARRGVTRWWNGALESSTAPGVSKLLGAYRSGQLEPLGMSVDVADSFKRVLTEEEEYRLAALRCPDTFGIEWKIGDAYRRIDRLSGGQQVSILLSLLLETDDDTPLVIDQPEDELDNAYLTETVLPRLRQLKGRRQVVFATHDANIVVNGDADQVVCLRADSSGGWVAATGAIEDPVVMREILETLDGGEAAFALRREKYGF